LSVVTINLPDAYNATRQTSTTNHNPLNFPTCWRRCFRIRISSCACLWNRFSFRTIFRATLVCSLWSKTLTT